MPRRVATHGVGCGRPYAKNFRMAALDEPALTAIKRAFETVPFYAGQGITGLDGTLDEVLARLPLLTRDRVKPTLPKAWFPAGRNARAELAAGSIAVIEAGHARLRVLFDPRAWRQQEARALALHPRAASTLASEMSPLREAVLWVPENGTRSCGTGDPTFEERLEGSRLRLNSRQDPTFWTEPVMTRMLDEVTLHETTALLADPFYLDVLARHAAVLNRRLDVRGFIATTRARATLAHRRMLQRVFQGTVIDVLAAREVGTLFVEGEDGLMHHASRETHVELLPAKVPTPGAEDVAIVVVTTLQREVQPLVRYVLGDLVQVARGASDLAIRTAEGSIDDAIVRPDGALVTAGAIDRAVGADVRGYQLTQREPGALDLEVVGDVAPVARALAPLLEGMVVHARSTTAIAVEASGKYRATRRMHPAVSLSEAFDRCEGV